MLRQLEQGCGGGEPLSVRSDQDILKGEFLIGSEPPDELVGEGLAIKEL